MKQKDAWIFPVIGSGVLLGLYFLFKFFNEKYLNILLHIYFTLIGSFSIGQLFEEKIIEKEPFKTYNEKNVLTIPKIPYFVPEGAKITKLNIISIGIIYIMEHILKVMNSVLDQAVQVHLLKK